MTTSKFETTSLYLLGETSLFLGNIKNTTQRDKVVKKYLSKIKDIPYETLEEVKELNFTIEDYAFGAFMKSVMKYYEGDCSNTITKQEVYAAEKFSKFLTDSDMTHVELSPTDNSYYCRYDNKIYLGWNIAPLKKILKRSSLYDILIMTYLHEEGHRQDKLREKRLKEIERIIKHYGCRETKEAKTGKKLSTIKVPDNLFKKICKEAVRSEIAAWKYAEIASPQFDLNTDDLYCYKTWALYNYISNHQYCMKCRKVRLLDYVFISE